MILVFWKFDDWIVRFLLFRDQNNEVIYEILMSLCCLSCTIKHCRGVFPYFWKKKLFINITMAIATTYYGHFSITLDFHKKTVLLPRVVFSLNLWPMRKPIKCLLMLWTNTMKRVMLFGAMTTILCSFQNA